MAWIDIDTAELGDVRLHRALNDPIIAHKYTTGWVPDGDNEIYDDIKDARLHQAATAPLDERIEYATTPETALYLSTATMDASYATAELVDIYQQAYREYLQTWTDSDPDTLGPPLSEDPGLDDYLETKYDDIRRAIKTDRDRWFVQNMYDDLDIQTIPKTYWLSEPVVEDDGGRLDPAAQQAVEDV